MQHPAVPAQLGRPLLHQRRGGRPEVRLRAETRAALSALGGEEIDRGEIRERPGSSWSLARARRRLPRPGQRASRRVHLIADMDWQPKYRPEAASAFFADGRTMRPLGRGHGRAGRAARGPGAVARQGRGRRVPDPAAHARSDAQLARRGQERFNIYCAPCHDRAASGHGTVVMRGFPPPTDLASARILALPDGQIFDTITNGVRNMPSYATQIPPEDRWAIVRGSACSSAAQPRRDRRRARGAARAARPRRPTP